MPIDYKPLYAAVKDLRRHAKAEGYPKPLRLTARRKGALRAIVEAAEEAGAARADEVAFFLATDIWETGGRILPVYEAYANSPEQASARLEHAWRQGRLRWVKHKYWLRDTNGDYWIGRGMVQITHRSNYAGKARKACREKFGVDILENPEAVMRVDVSAFILVNGILKGWFTRYRLSHYLRAGKALDYAKARKTVNPGDKSSFVPIKRLAERLERALRKAGLDAPRPDVTERAGYSQRLLTIQTRLKRLGYHEVGTLDGVWGPRTQAAVLAFKNEHGLPLNLDIDEKFILALDDAEPRKSAPARANVTASKLAEMGSTDIARANTGMQTGALVAGGAGVVGAAREVLPVFKENSGTLSEAVKLAGDVAAFIEGHAIVFAGASGLLIMWIAWRARRNRVIKHRTGEYLSR